VHACGNVINVPELKNNMTMRVIKSKVQCRTVFVKMGLPLNLLLELNSLSGGVLFYMER